MPGENLSPQKRQERRLAALRLSGQIRGGVPISGADPHVLIPRSRLSLRQEGEGPDARMVSCGEYHADEDLQKKFLRMRRALSRSKRFFILHGPPGSGKDAFMEEIAAGAYMPYRFFNLGGSTDLNQIKGGDGIRPEPVYRSRSVPALGPGGEEIRGEGGELLWEDERELLGAVPRTAEILGEVVRWMKEPSVIVLQEPEGQQQDMVQFHSALGDRLGESSGRKVFVDSAHGTVHSVHPDCIIAITHNAREGQDDFPPATKDRAVHFSFDYPEPEAEAERMALVVEKIMRGAAELYPRLARSYSRDELLPWARALRGLRIDLEGRPGADSLGFRTASDAFCEMIQAAAEGLSRPVDALAEALEFLYIGEFQARDERVNHFRSMIADHEQAIAQAALRSVKV